MTKGDETMSDSWKVWGDEGGGEDGPVPKRTVGIGAGGGGVCTYCGNYYEQMGMVINWAEKVGEREETINRLICVKCLIKAFDNALGRART